MRVRAWRVWRVGVGSRFTRYSLRPLSRPHLAHRRGPVEADVVDRRLGVREQVPEAGVWLRFSALINTRPSERPQTHMRPTRPSPGGLRMSS